MDLADLDSIGHMNIPVIRCAGFCLDGLPTIGFPFAGLRIADLDRIRTFVEDPGTKAVVLCADGIYQLAVPFFIDLDHGLLYTFTGIFSKITQRLAPVVIRLLDGIGKTREQIVVLVVRDIDEESIGFASICSFCTIHTDDGKSRSLDMGLAITILISAPFGISQRIDVNHVPKGINVFARIG